MRKFDYRKDYGIVSSTIKEYINILKSDVEWLYKNEKNEQYMDALIQINEFIKKYPNFHDIHEKILDDLLTPENVEYCFKNNVYKKDASKLGVEFQKDLEKIIELEEKLKKLAIEKWKKDLTPFEKIENGEDFMIVGHASYHLPGVYGDNNYHTGPHSRQFISCLLLSDKELNTFYNHRIVYITKVNEENYICSASFDSVTSEDTIPNFLTVGKIKENEQTHYIKSGFTYGGKVNTTISTPKRIEIESIKQQEKCIIIMHLQTKLY